MTSASITGFTAVFAAILTFLFTYTTNRRLNRDKARLERVNCQLSDFYGPLLALTRSNDRAWSTFSREYGAGPVAFFGSDDASVPPERVEAWVEWMRVVFMPSNRKIVHLIETKADLLEDDDMPEFLTEFCAHVASFEVTLKRWAAGDFSVLRSLLKHPGSPMSEYASQKFTQLKGQQRDLISNLSTTNPQSRSEPEERVTV